MPFPRSVALANKRYTNRFIEPVVRRFSGFGVVAHVGRNSGCSYSTPVYAFEADSAVLVALTYGPTADWVKNVMATGGVLTWRESESRIVAHRVVDRSVAWPYLPSYIRIALRVLRVVDFMLLQTDATD